MRFPLSKIEILAMDKQDFSNIQLRNNVNVLGNLNGPTLILAHGFGCDQNMWRSMLPGLLESYRIVLFDYVGSGNSTLAYYSTEKYSQLEGYAQDVIDIIDELSLKDVTIIAHSVSATIAAIASISAPETIKKIIMVCPSPCFLNQAPDYNGGFERPDLEELLDLMDKNYIGWANYLAPLLIGNADSPELVGELSGSFCSTDPIVAKTFAKTTFLCDYRHILSNLTCDTLILQSAYDNLASVEVGQYMHDNIANNKIEVVEAQGHCLHMTHPKEITPLILNFLE
jgi:sigma-B regulation protein RsbQ